MVGELLFKVSGISGKAEIEEEEEAEDTALAETSKRALVEILGAERRDRILSALYLTRQDAVNVVRQSAGHIWKALVYNTPRTGIVTSFPPRFRLPTVLSQSERYYHSSSAKSSIFCRMMKPINRRYGDHFNSLSPGIELSTDCCSNNG